MSEIPGRNAHCQIHTHGVMPGRTLVHNRNGIRRRVETLRRGITMKAAILGTRLKNALLKNVSGSA
jgi:hypothetical protein